MFTHAKAADHTCKLSQQQKASGSLYHSRLLIYAAHTSDWNTGAFNREPDSTFDKAAKRRKLSRNNTAAAMEDLKCNAHLQEKQHLSSQQNRDRSVRLLHHWLQHENILVSIGPSKFQHTLTHHQAWAGSIAGKTTNCLEDWSTKALK